MESVSAKCTESVASAKSTDAGRGEYLAGLERALHCRFWLSRGSGEAWTIYEGELYLNANKEVMARCRADPARESSAAWARDH